MIPQKRMAIPISFKLKVAAQKLFGNKVKLMSTNVPTQKNIFPGISVAGAATAGLAKGAIRAAPKIYQRAKAFFTAGSTPQNIGAKLLKIAGFGTAAGLGSYAATGTLPSLSSRTIAGYTAAQLSPAGALFGAASGGFDAISDFAKSQIPPRFSSVPGQITPDELQLMISKGLNTAYQNFPSMPNTSFDFGGVGALPPISYEAPSLSIGGSFGGGGFDPTALLLLLGGLGLGGAYLLGKKKRKKKSKKYKKRRKY